MPMPTQPEPEPLEEQAGAVLHIIGGCKCGRSFLKSEPRETLCPECAREVLVEEVHLVEWAPGTGPHDRAPREEVLMAVEFRAGLTDTQLKARQFIAQHAGHRLYGAGDDLTFIFDLIRYASPSVVTLSERDVRGATCLPSRDLAGRRFWLFDTLEAFSDGGE